MRSTCASGRRSRRTHSTSARSTRSRATSSRTSSAGTTPYAAYARSRGITQSNAAANGCCDSSRAGCGVQGRGALHRRTRARRALVRDQRHDAGTQRTALPRVAATLRSSAACRVRPRDARGRRDAALCAARPRSARAPALLARLHDGDRRARARRRQARLVPARRRARRGAFVGRCRARACGRRRGVHRDDGVRAGGVARRTRRGRPGFAAPARARA